VKKQLRYLEVEWLNYTDNGDEWIAFLQAKIERENEIRLQEGRNAEPPMPLDVQQWWRDLFANRKDAFWEFKKRDWKDVFLHVLSSRGPVRRADNPVFTGALLRLLDDRKISAQELERALGIAKGHLHRTFKERAGVLWYSIAGEEKRGLDHQGMGRLSNYYVLPLEACVLVDGQYRQISSGENQYRRIDTVASSRAPFKPALLPDLRLVKALEVAISAMRATG
jgi:hypothetical protein